MMELKDKTIGIIGCGNMGAALVENLKKKAHPKDIFVIDKDREKQNSIVRVFQVKGCDTTAELVTHSDAVIIAVKPQDIEIALVDLKGISGKLIISIAAGIVLASLQEKIGKKMPIVRAMPNLNALIGRSVTALCRNKAVKKEDLDFAEEIFRAVGEVVFVKESQMNAVTAISGSGPAFVAYLIKDLRQEVLERVMILEAVLLKIEPATAKVLAAATVEGTATNLSTNFDPEMLIKRVSSKGGTTEAGMKELEKRGKTIEGLRAAIQAANKRAEELSRPKNFIGRFMGLGRSIQ